MRRRFGDRAIRLNLFRVTKANGRVSDRLVLI